VQYTGGAVVTAQGKSKEHFFIIVRGKVEVERYGQEAACLGEGNYFRETALLVDFPAAATITTIELNPTSFLNFNPQSSLLPSWLEDSSYSLW
jgi:CRP-like cAMP-binding protein